MFEIGDRVEVFTDNAAGLRRGLRGTIVSLSPGMTFAGAGMFEIRFDGLSGSRWLFAGELRLVGIVDVLAELTDELPEAG